MRVLKDRLVTAAGLIIFLSLSCVADARERSQVRAALPGSSYDFAVRVPNSYDYGYNPTVRLDRIHSARQAVKSFCARSEVVGDEIINTQIWGLTSSPREYVVYVVCKSHRGDK